MSEERKDELKELIDLLKQTIVELRGIADQLGNPLVSPLPAQEHQAESKEEVSKPSELEKVSEKESLSIKPQPSQKVGEEMKKTSEMIRPKVSESLAKVSDTLSKVREISSQQEEASKLLKLAKLIYELSDRVPPEYFSKLVEFIGNLGLADKGQIEALKSLVEIVKMSNEYGFSLEESLALLALILRELGIEEREIVDEVLKRVVRKQGAEKWESQQR